MKHRVFFHSQKGASLVEYSLLVSLIAVIVITGVQSTGVKTKCRYETISAGMDGQTAICSTLGEGEEVGSIPNPPDIFDVGTGGQIRNPGR